MHEIPLDDDGQISLTFRRGDGSAVEITDDLLLLRLECEALEAKHKLPVQDGCLHATADFLADLTARLKQRHASVTPTIAAHVWRVTSEKFAAAKKNTNDPPNLPTGTESTRTY